MALFIITSDPSTDEVIAAIGMGNAQADIIHSVLSDLLTQEMTQEWMEDFDIAHECLDSQSIADIPANVFMQANDLLVTAINKHIELEFYAQDIIGALKADPRFKTTAAT